MSVYDRFLSKFNRDWDWWEPYDAQITRFEAHSNFFRKTYKNLLRFHHRFPHPDLARKGTSCAYQDGCTRPDCRFSHRIVVRMVMNPNYKITICPRSECIPSQCNNVHPGDIQRIGDTFQIYQPVYQPAPWIFAPSVVNFAAPSSLVVFCPVFVQRAPSLTDVAQQATPFVPPNAANKALVLQQVQRGNRPQGAPRKVPVVEAASVPSQKEMPVEAERVSQNKPPVAAESTPAKPTQKPYDGPDLSWLDERFKDLTREFAAPQ